MLIAIKIIDHNHKFHHITHSLTILAWAVLISVHMESEYFDFTELSVYKHD